MPRMQSQDVWNSTPVPASVGRVLQGNRRSVGAGAALAVLFLACSGATSSDPCVE